LDLIINDSCSIAACKNDVRTVGIWFHFSFFFGSYQIARQGRIVSKCWATIVVYSLIGRSSPHFIRYFFLFLCYSLDGGFDEWLPAAADALPWSIRRCHLGKVDNVHAGHYLKKKYNKKKGDNKKKQNKEKHKIKEVPSGNEIFGWIRSLPACVYILSRHKKTKQKKQNKCAGRLWR
jgi:hypothetical protein